MPGELTSIGRSAYAAQATTPRARDGHPLAQGCCAACDGVFASMQSGREVAPTATARPVTGPSKARDTAADDEGRKAGVIVKLSAGGQVVAVDPNEEKASLVQTRTGAVPGGASKDGATPPGGTPSARPDTAETQAGPATEGGEGEARTVTADGKPELEAHEVREVERLKDRDREVKAHEQAHKSAAGQHGGAISLSYKTGPDGRRYAVSGEVPVDLSPVQGNPGATVRKMSQIRQAALAPADPSAADRAAAARATSLQQKAQADLAEVAAKRMEQAGGPVKTQRALEDEVKAEDEGKAPQGEGASGPKSRRATQAEPADARATAPGTPTAPKPSVAAAPPAKTSLNFYA